jgi:hypothetical protein
MFALRNAVFNYDPSMVLWGIDPISVKKNVGFEVRRKMTKQQLKEEVREPMAVINPSVSFNGWKPLRSQNKETL